MTTEVQLDISEGVLVESVHFNDRGRSIYEASLLQAAAAHDESWLAATLSGCFKEIDTRGRKVRFDQNTLFAGCEFNRFYVRAVCRFAAENPGHGVRIYRARESSSPRDSSESKIGSIADHEAVLADLRSRLATNPHLGLPEINSGLSLELVFSK